MSLGMLRTTFSSGTGSGMVEPVQSGLVGTGTSGAGTPPGPHAVSAASIAIVPAAAAIRVKCRLERMKLP